jgi:hypothetical protein
MNRLQHLFISCLVCFACLLGIVLTATQTRAQGSEPVAKRPPCPDFSVTGIESRAKLEPFFEQVKTAVTEGDAKHVAELIEYPIFAKVGGHRILIPNKAVFEKNGDEILSEKVKKAARAQSFSGVVCNYQGVMFGEGEIWISKIKPRKGKPRLRIKAINN